MAIDLVEAKVNAAVGSAVEIRHHLHQNPELSHYEEQTSRYVVERLVALGLTDVKSGVGGYGVVANLSGTAGPGPTLAIRADMDALPIQEAADRPYKSCVPGVMHACGHDGHTATLLGTVAVLSQLRGSYRGSVRFVFQPAEETVGGAARMCSEGVMEGVDAIIALHGWPGLEVGQIGVRPGPMMASADTFDIVIRGRAAHAAQPQNGIDPIVVGAQLVLALQTIASRETSPTDSVVVTVAQIHAGTAYNIIPTECAIKGTVRCLTETERKLMPERIERIARGICAAFRAEYTFEYHYGTPVTVNDPAVTSLVETVAAESLGAANVVLLDQPSMGAEDFAMFMHHAPGTMFRLGVGLDVTPLHTPTYNFTDAAIPVGMEVFTRVALSYLAPTQNP